MQAILGICLLGAKRWRICQ